jgi:hypothetical protein
MKYHIIWIVVFLSFTARVEPLFGQCGIHITSVTYYYEGSGTYNCVVQGTDSACKLLRLEVLNGRTVLKPPYTNGIRFGHRVFKQLRVTP